MGADQFGLANAYRCIFGSTNITTAASSVSAQSLRCAQPSASSLALLPGEGTLQLVRVHHFLESRACGRNGWFGEISHFDS